MIFAGTPPTTVFSGTSIVTTAPAAITAPSPMVTPGSLKKKSTEKYKDKILYFQCFKASPRRLERPTYRLGGDRSIQLSYEDLYEKPANKQVIQLIKLFILHSVGNMPEIH